MKRGIKTYLHKNIFVKFEFCGPALSLIYALYTQHLRENSFPIYTPNCAHNSKCAFIVRAWTHLCLPLLVLRKKEIALQGRVGQEEEKASERCRSGLYDIQRRAVGSKATGLYDIQRRAVGSIPTGRNSASKYTVFSIFLRICTYQYVCTEVSLNLRT